MQAQQKPYDDDYAATDIMLKLPPTRGKIIPDAPLAEQTWFCVGGPAEALFKPADVDDLSFFLANCPDDVPITILGLASNVLIRDGGIPGVVIKLGPSFAHIKVLGADLVVGSAAVNSNVSRTAQSVGISGLEFLSGIPGTIGGGIRMNAGAYGSEFKDIVSSVVALDRDGNSHTLYADQMGFSYRNCKVPKDWIFIETMLSGEAGDPGEIQKKIKEIQESRIKNQPIREKTAGSTFANPDNDPSGRKTWQLIEAAGCRGLKMGNAKVSEKHCNFLINTGKATALEIENLGEEVRRRVKDKTGVELRWEVQRIGIEKKETEE
ncbi:MAG: UDP-N-acetylmuramate dehydrogenase [Alphaproteobacteria bacterium]|nr:UDP-N-acetylmuramate dehydrogenase [Alphaproteobacteria bacterium]